MTRVPVTSLRPTRRAAVKVPRPDKPSRFLMRLPMDQTVLGVISAYKARSARHNFFASANGDLTGLEALHCGT